MLLMREKVYILKECNMYLSNVSILVYRHVFKWTTLCRLSKKNRKYIKIKTFVILSCKGFHSPRKLFGSEFFILFTISFFLQTHLTWENYLSPQHKGVWQFERKLVSFNFAYTSFSGCTLPLSPRKNWKIHGCESPNPHLCGNEPDTGIRPGNVTSSVLQ